MFEWLFGSLNDPNVGAVGNLSGHCSSADHNYCNRLDMIHQGQVIVPKNPDLDISHLKTLRISQFPGHTRPEYLTGEGPAVVREGNDEKIFSFTARVEPGDAIVDGLRIDWTAPPDATRILVSPALKGKWHEATGWVPTKADGRFAGGIPQTQNVVFSQPELIKRVEVQIKDAPNSTKTQFGIDQVSLITNARDRNVIRS